MAKFDAILNATILVEFELDGHIVRLPLHLLLDKLDIKISEQKLTKTVQEMVEQHG